MLRVEGLSVPGLDPVSFTAGQGECIAIAGPSGSGKTLLLRAIADLDPVRGDVSLDDADREEMPAPRWRGLVIYVPAVSGWWRATVSQHFQDWAEAAPLTGILRLPAECGTWTISRLSTGEQQRLALVRALSRHPKVLLLDEPTSALDAMDTEAVEHLIEEFRNDDGTVLWVSHDAGQRHRVATRTLTIADGRLREGSA